MDDTRGRARRQATTRIVVVGTVAGVALALLATFGVLELAYWNIAHCTGAAGADTRGCEQAGWIIDFWWVAFLPLTLALAWGLRRWRDRIWARLDA